jgi:HD-GYP domain-containing protein (c-di-GMP phosphodiesterase class II)
MSKRSPPSGRNSGTQFDPNLVQAFLAIHEEFDENLETYGENPVRGTNGSVERTDGE